MKYLILALLLFGRLDLSAQIKQSQSVNANINNADTISKADSAHVKTPLTKIIRICTPTKYNLLHPPLYVVFYKGKIITQADTDGLLKKLPPKDLKAIRILKGVNAVKKYGEKGKNGVIEIDLKYRKDKKLFK